jgi:DNA-binding transcriptional MerR regulator
MGHRCYSEKDVKILQRVKTLKDKGIQLKAIKDMVHRMYELLDEGESTEEKNADDAVTELIAERENTEKKTIETIRVSSDVGDDSRIVDFKMAQFQNIMDKIISNSIKDNLKVITQSVSAAVSDDVVKQMDVLMKDKMFTDLELKAMKQIQSAKIDYPSPLMEHNRIQQWVREVFEKVALGKISEQEAAKMLVDDTNAQLRRLR